MGKTNFGTMILIAAAFMLAPGGESAGSGSGLSMKGPGHGSSMRHHRPNHRPPWWGLRYYGYGYPYDYGDGGYDLPPAPLAQPVRQAPVASPPRKCEPETFRVPSESGGESSVTIIRC